MLSIISISDHLDHTLADLALTVRTAARHRVGDITLRELAATAALPYGVYIFFDSNVEGDCLYVGKVSSRSYTERIPMHFDPRAKSWMNQFARYVSEKQCDSNYAAGLLQALDQYIMFIGFDFTESDEANKLRARRINELETVLRSYLKPKLNPPSKPRTYLGTETIGSLLPKPDKPE